MYRFELNKQMFCDKPERFLKLCSKNYLVNEPSKVIDIDNGIVLPCRKSNNIPYYKCEGGVVDSSYNFIAGHVARYYDSSNECDWYNCELGYMPIKEIIKKKQTVIFGGILINHFGHFLCDSMSRLWYVAKNSKKYKIVFINFPEHDCSKLFDILYTFGLNESDFEVITEPTQFDKIIVPEQSLFRYCSYKPECQLIYDKIISNIKPGSFKKIYLSKSKYIKNSSLKEVYFEDFYKKRGFEIIYPETLSFRDQVAILNGADEVVCAMGTIQHLTFFCKYSAKVTVFARDYSSGPINTVGLFSLQMRNIESYFVDITFNFLPVLFTSGVFLFGPTKHWIDYLDSQSISYEPEEVSFDIHVKTYIYDYLIDWAQYYNQNYSRIKNQTLPDVINLIHRTFLDETIDTKKFPERDDVVKMQNQIKELTATVEKQKKQLEEQKQSLDLKENITQVVTQMGLHEAHQKLARQTEDKFNIVRNIVTKMEADLKSSDKTLEEKCEILKDQVKKQNEKIKLLEERFIQLEENSKSKGLFGKK